mmetsp:Transcript_5899/g.14484  ORF Transcript_5899/g.14484 Transcript_5899/m.14484 type:complete len:245 (-) Transcript_5899:1458-2192(-)
MHQAQPVRLGGVETLGRHEVAPRGLLAQGLHHIGPDGGGQQAELGLTEAEAGRVHRDDDVGTGHQAHAAGVDIALHAGDDRHRAAVDRPEHVGQPRGVGVVFGPAVASHGLHPVQVGAGAEGLALGREHDGAQLGVLAQRGERGRQFGDQHFVEGVADLGAVQRDAGDGALGRDGQAGAHRGGVDGVERGDCPPAPRWVARNSARRASAARAASGLPPWCTPPASRPLGTSVRKRTGAVPSKPW